MWGLIWDTTRSCPPEWAASPRRREAVDLFADHIDLSANWQHDAFTSRITVHRVAVTAGKNQGGTVAMQVPRFGWDISSIDGRNKMPGAQVSNVRAVARSLDEDAPANEQACAMKLDVEGSEPAAIRGAARLLARRPQR